MELETREPEEKPSISKKLVKLIAIGASLVGLGAWLFRKRQLFHHTIPPIIIKSVDDATEPIEVQSTTTLAETSSLGTAGALSGQKDYTLAGFGPTKFIKVCRENPTTGPSAAPEEYRNHAGSVVQLWLQHKQGGSGWQDEPHGPHLVITGTSWDFVLESDQLSRDKPNGHPVRKRKRSYNKNKNWRIGAIQVDSNPQLSTAGYRDVTIEFANHFF